MIPEHKIQEVLERADIVQVVGRHVELKRSGKSFKGRCPFHQEKSASFYVTPEMRRFKCFGCQAGGDAISFVQRYLGKTFLDAVRDLAREVGVDLEGAVDPAAQERQQIKDATDVAYRHFRERFADPSRGQKARAYLESRGVSAQMAEAFGLGWAENAWSDLADRLTKEGMLAFGEKAGLVQKRTRGEGYFDVFRGRLMVPIRSPEGRTIAFGGRLLEGDDGPKYLNSRESRLYQKSDVLFGMDQARDELRKKKSAILVEGYFDCIGLHQVGVRNAVALCSTALTPGHLALLSRAEAKELVLLLDGDEAGRKAVERLSGTIIAAGFAAKVAALPDGEDPDTFARKVGPDGVQTLLDAAPPLTQYLFAVVLPDGPASTFEAKMLALQRLRPVAEKLPVGLARSAFFAALSQHLGLPASQLEAELRGKTQAPIAAVPKPSPVQARPSAARPEPRSAPPNGPANGVRPQPPVSSRPNPPHPSAEPPGPPRVAERPPDPLEARLVAALIRDPKLQTLDEHRVVDELAHAGLRSTLAHALRQSPEDALFEAPPPVRSALDQAARDLPAADPDLEPFFRTLCRRLKLRRIEESLTYIARVTGKLAGQGELDEDTRRLIEQRVELLALKRRLLETDAPQGRNRH